MKAIDTKAREAFVEATKKTFSEMAFIDTTVTGMPDQEPEPSHLIYLPFLEPERGFVLLFLPYNCKKLIVENIYGEEWRFLQLDQIDDCLLELLNVLVGNYLSDLYGEDVKRDMALPRLLFDETEIPIRDKNECIYFDAEGELFKAELNLIGEG